MAAGLATWAVTAYRALLSPLHPPTCRFVPSCSAYALEAYRVHGFWKGTGLAFLRLMRCHPFHPGGYDPVPSASTPYETPISKG